MPRERIRCYLGSEESLVVRGDVLLRYRFVSVSFLEPDYEDAAQRWSDLCSVCRVSPGRGEDVEFTDSDISDAETRWPSGSRDGL